MRYPSLKCTLAMPIGAGILHLVLACGTIEINYRRLFDIGKCSLQRTTIILFLLSHWMAIILNHKKLHNNTQYLP